MKKLLAILSTSVLMGSAAAADFGITASRDWGGGDLDRAGFSLRMPVDQRLAFEAAVERNVQTASDQDRYSLAVTYEVTKLGPVAIDGRFGVAYLHNSVDSDGLMGLVGLGARLPITKTIVANAVLGRQVGHNDMSKFDTNVVSLGLTYKF